MPTSATAAGRYPIAAAALAILLAGTFMPTPLYELYRRVWGLTPAEISLVFAVYAGSLIPALLFLGGVSDRIGRRRTLLLASALMAFAALVLAFATGLWWLVAARLVQGVAMGIGIGTATVAIREWMDESMRPRAGVVSSVAVAAGSGLGALLGGVLGQYGPLPLALPYVVYIGLLACVAVAIATVPSCAHLQPTAHTAIPSIPAAIRRPFLVASGQSLLTWSAFALFFSLVPSFLATTLGLHNLIVGALVVVGVQLGAVSASVAGRTLSPRTAIVAGLLTVGAGVWLLILAVPLHAVALVAVSTLAVGAGGGLSYLAGLNIVGTVAPPDHRAELMSAFFVACYVGFSVPALAVGVAANWFGLYASLVAAAIVLGVLALATVALTTDRNLRAGA
jgi:predicted MFS family arabinose efflux permease